MKFKAENDLVRVLKRKLKETYSRENIEIFEEVSLGYGIADIVVSNILTEQAEVTYDEEILNHCDISLYNLINKNPKISFNLIIETTKSSKKVISNSLQKLINRGFVKQINDSFSIQNEYRLSFKNNYAVEAKLKDWKRALYQAYRYKWFAEYSYVVIDAHYSLPAIRNINMFIKQNVGLATLTPDGTINRIFTPKRQRPYDLTMQMLFSEKIRTYTLLR